MGTQREEKREERGGAKQFPGIKPQGPLSSSFTGLLSIYKIYQPGKRETYCPALIQVPIYAIPKEGYSSVVTFLYLAMYLTFAPTFNPPAHQAPVESQMGHQFPLLR